MRKSLIGLVAVVAMVATYPVFAGSDGNYSPAAMHCSGHASSSATPEYSEDGCHSITVTVSDVGGHEYFGVGYQHTPAGARGPLPVLPFYELGSNLQRAAAWTDLGQGCTRYTIDVTAPGAPTSDACPWMNPIAPNYYPRYDAEPNPASGIRIYFGDDDNSSGGEHDGSALINNGASDAGGFHVVLDPASVAPWVDSIVSQNPQYVLTHPLPVGDAGLGFCADGICFSIQTQRQVAYKGGSSDPNDDRAAADYTGHNWDPESCTGASPQDDGTDPTSDACNDPNDPNQHQDITYWNNQVGTRYAEPGVQIYEDPDPEGSPIGPYPLPAIYVGTCGVIIGGGFATMPSSPYTNPETGQLILTDRALTDGDYGC